MASVPILDGFNPLRAVPVDARTITSDRTSIDAATVFQGMIVYDTSENEGERLYVYNGTTGTNIAESWIIIEANTGEVTFENSDINNVEEVNFQNGDSITSSNVVRFNWTTPEDVSGSRYVSSDRTGLEDSVPENLPPTTVFFTWNSVEYSANLLVSTSTMQPGYRFDNITPLITGANAIPQGTVLLVSSRNEIGISNLNITNSLNLERGINIEFVDQEGTFPTDAGILKWSLPNDRFCMYAEQPTSDALVVNMEMIDNATSTDRFQLWINDFRGASFDRYPIVANGTHFYVFPPTSGTAGVPDLSDWAMRVTAGGDVDIKDDLEIGDDLTVGGTGTVGGALITSDERLKEDIVDLPIGLEEIVALRPRQYTKYGEENRQGYQFGTRYGFIAQEIDDEIPEVVYETNTGYKGVSYSELVPVLTKAIQELNAKVVALEARVSELESDE